MTDFATTPLKDWNRTSDEFRVVASTTSGPKTSSIGKVLYNLKAFFGMEPGMLKDLKSENKASVERFKNDINSFFDQRANRGTGKASAYGQIHPLATKQLDYLKEGRRLSDRSIRQVMTHVSTLTDAVDTAAKQLENRYSSWVRNEALQQLDMDAILRSAGALDEDGNMKRVLTDEEKKNINEGVASKLEELCHAVKGNLIQHNNAVWDGVASPQGLNELIGRDPRGPISSFRLFGTEAKDQTFFQEAERNINSVKQDLDGKWDQEPLDEGALKERLGSEMSRLASKWGSGISQSKPFSNPENAKFGDSHPELNLFITSALARELQNASPKDSEKKPLMAWEDAYKNAEWDHTLRNEKFAQFLAGRQIDQANLPAEEKIASKQVLANLLKLGNECLEDNRIFGNKDANDLRGSSQSLDSGYSTLGQRHDKAKSFLQSAKNFHPQTPELTHLHNGLVAMATRAVTGLKASLDAYETVIKERHDVGVETYGEDIVNLIKSNPERLNLVSRAKDTPIAFERSMVPRFIDSLEKDTTQQPGDKKTASVCRNAWNLISRQVSDPTLGQPALNQQDAFNNFGKMETNRLIEVTKAHETVVDQIQNQLSEVRGRQQTLSKDAPKILHDSLASFANALEKRRKDAAGPAEDARKELDSRRNKASENATVFESRFGKPLTDLVKTHAGEVFEEIPNVSQEKVVAASLTAKDSPGFAILEQTSRGLLDRVVAHIGNASQSDAITGMSQSDLLKLTNSELDSLLDRSSGLSANLKNDQAMIEEVLETLATPGDTGRVAKNKSDEFLVSFLVAANVALQNQIDALEPVQQSASKIAAGRASTTYSELMPNLHKATSGSVRPVTTSSTSPSHVALSVNKALAESNQTHRQALRNAASVAFRIRNAFATAQQNRKAWDRGTETVRAATRLRESPEFREFSKMVDTGESEWKAACKQMEEIVKATKPTLGIGGDSKTHSLATAILSDLQSINFERMRDYVGETLASLSQL
jgi:hypothetical protein